MKKQTQPPDRFPIDPKAPKIDDSLVKLMATFERRDEFKPPHVAFTDHQLFENWQKDRLRDFFLLLVRMYGKEAKKRAKVWVLLDEDDYKRLVERANEHIIRG